MSREKAEAGGQSTQQVPSADEEGRWNSPEIEIPQDETELSLGKDGNAISGRKSEERNGEGQDLNNSTRQGGSVDEKATGRTETEIANLSDQTASSPSTGPLSSDATPLTSPLEIPTEDAFDYPEGGLRAWLVVFGSWCGLFASLGIANTLATFQAYMSDSQLSNYTPGAIGWIFSLYTFVLFACGIYIGPLFDVYGPRWLILPGSACVILTIFLLGVCTQYWHFIVVFGMIGGIGSSLLFTPCFAACGHFFMQRRGNATGLAATGGAFGGIVFPLLLQSLIPKIGFAWSTRVMGFIILFLIIIANLLITSRLPPSLAGRSPHPDFKILAQPAFAMTVLGVFLLEWALFIPLTYITSYALHEGFDQAFSYQILPILNVGSVFGRWLPGFYSDKIGRYNTTILFVLLTILSIFVIWLPFGSTTPGLVIFSLLFGFASGSNISLTPVCIGQLCLTQDYGRYYATCYTIVSFGCLTGIPIAGVILERCGGKYWGLILWTGCCYVGAAGAFVVARGLAGGWSLKRRY